MSIISIQFNPNFFKPKKELVLCQKVKGLLLIPLPDRLINLTGEIRLMDYLEINNERECHLESASHKLALTMTIDMLVNNPLPEPDFLTRVEVLEKPTFKQYASGSSKIVFVHKVREEWMYFNEKSMLVCKSNMLLEFDVAKELTGENKGGGHLCISNAFFTISKKAYSLNEDCLRLHVKSIGELILRRMDNGRQYQIQLGQEVHKVNPDFDLEIGTDAMSSDLKFALLKVMPDRSEVVNSIFSTR